MMRESDSELRNESTALTPCAFRNATFGVKPPAVDRLTVVLSNLLCFVSVEEVAVLEPGVMLVCVPSGRVKLTASPGDLVVVVVVRPAINWPLPMVKRCA